MGYIVLSKQQVEGELNAKLCKDKASADSYRKQLIKQYHDVVILSKGDYKLIASKLFKAWVNEEFDEEDDNNPDPIWNGPSYGCEYNSFDTNSDKHNEIYKHNYGGDEEAHKAWDRENIKPKQRR